MAFIPPVCFHGRLNEAHARLQHIWTVGGVEHVNDDDVGGSNPGLLKKGLGDLRAGSNIDCDECLCLTVQRWNPPLEIKVPPYIVEESTETDKNGVVNVHKYQVVGAIVQLKSLGCCLAPGSQVKTGGQWVPAEDAVKQGAGGVLPKQDKPEKKEKQKHHSKPKRRAGKTVAKKRGRGSTHG